MMILWRSKCTTFIAGIVLMIGAMAQGNPMLIMMHGQQLILGQSAESPATSCLAIYNAGASRGTGVYWLTTGTAPYKAFCDMTAASPGWTLIMRMANDTTLTYDSAYWTDANIFDGDSTNSLTPNLNYNAKFSSFINVAGTQIRGCSGDHTGSCFYMNMSTSVTARSLFSGAAQSGSGTITRANLEATFGVMTSVPNCNMIGSNKTVGGVYGRVRLGVLANGEADCVTPDSTVGWGGKRSNSVGCGSGRSDYIAGANYCAQGSLWIK